MSISYYDNEKNPWDALIAQMLSPSTILNPIQAIIDSYTIPTTTQVAVSNDPGIMSVNYDTSYTPAINGKTEEYIIPDNIQETHPSNISQETHDIFLPQNLEPHNEKQNTYTIIENPILIDYPSTDIKDDNNMKLYLLLGIGAIILVALLKK
jgi:hypothetical protein